MASIPAVSAPPVGGAFEELAKTVLSGAAATITFSGLDTTNRMFRLTGYLVKDGSGGDMRLRLNNDSGASYDHQGLSGNGVTVSANRKTADAEIELAVTVLAANEHATFEILIAKQQTGDEAMVVSALTFDAGAGIRTANVAGIWNNTADLINRLDILASAGNFAADTVALLEGNSTT